MGCCASDVEVRGRGILQNMSDSMIVQTLASIFDAAGNQAPYGVTNGDLADSVLAGYGLSERDGIRVINTSLPQCNW